MELPNSWASIIFSDAVINISITGKKIPQKDYLDSGSYPIIDQGQEYVDGYSYESHRKLFLQSSKRFNANS